MQHDAQLLLFNIQPHAGTVNPECAVERTSHRSESLATVALMLIRRSDQCLTLQTLSN